MKIAFFGNTKYSTIDARILNERFGLALIVTKPDKPRGRNRVLTPNPVKQFSQENKIPFITADKLGKSVVDEIKKYNLDFLVIADYGLILPKEVLEIPKYAPVNVHHSLLPKYRGPSPAPSTILAGDTTSGVTIIKMTEDVDAGDILAQEKYQLEEDETTDSLLTKLNTLGGKLACDVIETYTEIKPKKQSAGESYTERFKKEDGFIDIENPLDPETVDRMIRAFYPWPGVWTKFDGKIIKFLPEKKIQPEGKKPMDIKAFLNGYPQTKDFIEKIF
ncbi:MAG: methionyl-tRNA formyltransferase [Candidatus Curtissbacteria bacterium]|nr:methionyl-tRNA formyltransferase [Candidatus Curtissbacteria bacterium]